MTQATIERLHAKSVGEKILSMQRREKAIQELREMMDGSRFDKYLSEQVHELQLEINFLKPYIPG